MWCRVCGASSSWSCPARYCMITAHISMLHRSNWKPNKQRKKTPSERKFYAFNMETNILAMSQPDINVFAHTSNIQNSSAKKTRTSRWMQWILYAKKHKWNDNKKTESSLYTHIHCVLKKKKKKIPKEMQTNPHSHINDEEWKRKGQPSWKIF